MVKGVARRVVMIKSPDPKIFDEAIFIVRDEAARRPGVTTEELLREARDVAESFVRRGRGAPRALPWWAWSAMGAGGVGLTWLLTALLL